MAFDELLTWSAGRPAWQQDALRCLAEHGELTQYDLSDLRRQIETSAGMPGESSAAIPLAAEHLSEAASNAPRTVLASLGPVKNVDRLESGQPAMRFAVNGITVIYGPNASGKSGYCRITKQLCRSLSPRTLRGNVFDAGTPPPAEIALAYRVGGDDDSKRDLTWRVGEPPPPELARISVFDTASAGVYVDKERKIEFLPYELDLLNRLGVAARTLDMEFKARDDTLAAATSMPLTGGYSNGTPAFGLISELGQAIPLYMLPSEQALRDAARWSDAEQHELDTLTEEARRDRQALARSCRLARDALTSLREDVAAMDRQIGDAVVARLFEAQRDASARSAAAQASAHELFGREPVPGVGSEIWRQFLGYARDFAAEAYPERDPPLLVTTGKCVLCHQELDEPAASRLAAFDSYLSGRAAAASVEADAAFSQAAAQMRAIAVKNGRTVQTMLGGYAALSEGRAADATTIKTYFENAAGRLNEIRRILDGQADAGLARLTPLPESPAGIIEREITALEVEAQAFDRLGTDSAAIALRDRRFAELTDRMKLGEQIAVVVERRRKLEDRARLAECRSQCKLTAITQQITKRRREILTPSLKNSLAAELAALQLAHIPLGLTDRGDLGESIVEVSLSAQQRIASNSEVLSEGEHRGLALACFLAELNEIGTDHGIIVDDPVSSLDHSRMETVARRLAQEAAKGRQVIVFTHNIVFHSMLRTEARRCRVACHQEWMSSLGSDRFGIIDDAHQPWQMKPVAGRLNDIAEARRALEASGYDPREDRFRGDVTGIYTRMRETWERVVEEILFNKVVERFRPEIMTLSLRAACFDTGSDYPDIFEGMKRTSHYSGHDRAEDLPVELPTLELVDADIDNLKAFVAKAKERQKKLEAEFKDYEKGIAPILL